MKPVIEKVETIYEGWATLLKATIRTSEGNAVTREIEDHGPAVAVLPYDAERRVATLIRQFRPPAFKVTGQDSVLEVPAGLLEEEDPDACARREVYEETGLAVSVVEPVTSAWAMPGLSAERMYLFFAPYREADRTGPGGGLAEENESITVCEIALADLARMADDGRLEDMKSLVLVQTLRLRRPELFA
jgi:nudix-type nucleoside diphosphatase (YffH/AdpP family)